MTVIHSGIKDVSETLLDMLKQEFGSGVKIALESPKNAGQNLLTLLLYKVVESPEYKNAEPITATKPNGSIIQRQPPLTLDAYYMLTAHSNGNHLEAHKALGRAMRLFYDNGVLHGSLLRHTDPADSGLTADSVVRITLNPISMEDMTRIWSVFPDTPYEISVTYLVTPVVVDSEREDDGAPVVDRSGEFGHTDALIGAGA
jgi:hypothetical protein